MTTHHTQSQAHGFEFEDILKKICYPTSTKISTCPDKWDVEKKDNPNGLPVSIKTSKNDTICLSGAIGYFSETGKSQLDYIRYRQVGNYKEPVELIIFKITAKEKKLLMGELNLEIVTNFHNKLKTFAYGDHLQAREYGKSRNEFLQEKYESHIKLNPKIGNRDNQRRLQCSVSVETLLSIVKTKTIFEAKNGIIEVNGKKFGRIYSPIRARKPNEFEIQKTIIVKKYGKKVSA